MDVEAVFRSGISRLRLARHAGAGTDGAEDATEGGAQGRILRQRPDLGRPQQSAPAQSRCRITQDFGYSETNFASTKKGELGGKVVRCMTPCYYAAKIDRRP